MRGIDIVKDLGPAMLKAILRVSASMLKAILRVSASDIPPQILFNGKIRAEHKTKYTFEQITDRYKESIKSFNSAVAFNVGFAVIALYTYLVLSPKDTVTLPFIGLSVTRLIWISLVPMISYGLQTFIFTSFVWFIVLRLCLKILLEKTELKGDFGDVTNILLNGTLGHIWMVYRISQLLKSRWSYVWYFPAALLSLILITSPMLICPYFIVQLFYAGSFWLGFAYSVVLVPYSILFFLLIVTASLLGGGAIMLDLNHVNQDLQEVEQVNQDKGKVAL